MIKITAEQLRTIINVFPNFQDFMHIYEGNGHLIFAKTTREIDGAFIQINCIAKSPGSLTPKTCAVISPAVILNALWGTDGLELINVGMRGNFFEISDNERKLLSIECTESPRNKIHLGETLKHDVVSNIFSLRDCANIFNFEEVASLKVCFLESGGVRFASEIRYFDHEGILKSRRLSSDVTPCMGFEISTEIPISNSHALREGIAACARFCDWVSHNSERAYIGADENENLILKAYAIQDSDDSVDSVDSDLLSSMITVKF